MVKTTPIDLNPDELNSFMISLSKCSGSYNILTSIITVPKEAKYINVKIFNIITDKNKAKTISKKISWVCKCKFNTSVPLHVIQIKNGIMKHVTGSVKIVIHGKRL